MNALELFGQIKKKRSCLCVGLDIDEIQIPPDFSKMRDPLFSFNKHIVDKTHKYAVAYKPNAAFYAVLGLKGYHALYKTVYYIKKKYPEIFVILDAKIGDIGNTSERYAHAVFEMLGADAVTLSPYLGADGLKPFFIPSYREKWGIVLGLTSNSGAEDFQTGGENPLYREVLSTVVGWTFTNIDNLMFVVGATKADKFAEIRRIVPTHFLLVPGVGAQGGSATEVIEQGANNVCGLLINSSRGIIFNERPARAAQQLQEEIAEALHKQDLF